MMRVNGTTQANTKYVNMKILASRDGDKYSKEHAVKNPSGTYLLRPMSRNGTQEKNNEYSQIPMIIRRDRNFVVDRNGFRG